MNVDVLLSRLDKVRKNGANQWMACCSAHEDKSPSLAIKELQDGRILIKCFAGCDAVNILSAVGLSMNDLFPDAPLGEFKGWFKLQADVMRKQLAKEEDKFYRERMVLEIAKNRRANGERLDKSDLDREQQAWRTLKNAHAI